MRPLNRRVPALLLALSAAALALPSGAVGSDAPLRERSRVTGKLGFSFLPPQHGQWLERDAKAGVAYYYKGGEVRQATFLLRAREGRVTPDLSAPGALLAFVQARPIAMADGARYANLSSSYEIDAQQPNCVRYRHSAHDTQAANRGSNGHLLQQDAGWFCLHPQDRRAAIDIAYSVRHAPDHDPTPLALEGERFLSNLKFLPQPQHS